MQLIVTLLYTCSLAFPLWFDLESILIDLAINNNDYLQNSTISYYEDLYCTDDSQVDEEPRCTHGVKYSLFIG